MSTASLAAGFADPARQSQHVFRAMMWAMARPGTPEPLDTILTPPAPLTPELAALALCLLDFETPVWLDASLAEVSEVAEFLRFHTSARIVPTPAEAAFALISDPRAMPPLAAFAQGEPDYPDRSCTLLMAVSALENGPLMLEGPGIDGTRAFGATPLPEDFVAQMAANRAGFPLGVDLVLAAPGAVLGLPRSVRLTEGM
ncbi:MAG: phosphonate C-P lyase system protein PhnH [Rhizobiales bacterium 17-65-6]|nr:MAG: phosphonate C-P lyase system protein PhnH [Rhizobiales bacterium 17-65-6]